MQNYAKCLISAWTPKQNVGLLARPAGGTVEKMGRCYSYYNVNVGCTACKINESVEVT